MKQLANDFINGTSTEKLSIISNFSTILGVSIATFVAGPFLNQFANIDFVASDFIVAVIFYFLCVWLSAYLSYSLALKSYKKYQQKNKNGAVKYIFLLIIVTWFGTVFFPIAKDTFSLVFSNNYLLPKPAIEAIVSIDDYSREKKGDIVTLKAKAIYNNATLGSNYRVVVYEKSSDSLYYPIRTANGEYSLQLTSSGRFTIPIDTRHNSLGETSIVIYRGLDRTFEGLLNSSLEYPKRFPQFDSIEVNKLGAFVFEPKT